MTIFSKWRDEIDLSEVVTDNLTDKKDKKITGDGVNNKKLIKIFPETSDHVRENFSVDGKVVPRNDELGAEDPQLKQKQKRINVAKRAILQKKLQAVRSGGGADITASHKPDGKLVEGEDWKPEIEHSKLGDAVKKKDEKKRKEAESSLPPHLKLDVMKKAFAHTNEAYRVLARDKGDKGKPAQFSYKDEKDANKFADSIKKDGGKVTVTKEEVGISSSAAMEKARKEAELKAKEDAAIKKAKKIKESRMDREPPSWSSMNPEDEGNPEYEKTQSYEDEQKWKKKQQKKKLKKEEIEMESYELTEELINDSIEDAIDYFSKQGINEEGLDLVIEEVGIDDFVEFVLDPSEDLMEARKARRANVKAKSYAQVKSEVDASDAAKKKAKKGEYAASYAKKETDVTVYDDKPAAKKKAAPRTQKGAMAYDGPNKERSEAADRVAAKKKKVTVKKAAPVKKAETKKKVVAATQTAKKKQPLKPISKQGLGSKIRSAVSKGVERHKAAVAGAKSEVGKVVKSAKATAKQHSQHRKDFVKGISPTDKEKKIAKGVGGAVKKALTREELELLEELSRRLLEGEESLDTKDKKEDEPEDDYRAMWTKANLVRQKLRAMGLRMSHEPEGDLLQEDDQYTVTNADKKANTKAWQNYQNNVKNVKTGKPLYKKADHFKSEGYQRNPEKGEEEERKAEKRRKASGAMPPRGDKRREDFERWYAANVR